VTGKRFGLVHIQSVEVFPTALREVSRAENSSLSALATFMPGIAIASFAVDVLMQVFSQYGHIREGSGAT
jgi:hypothetical protein